MQAPATDSPRHLDWLVRPIAPDLAWTLLRLWLGAMFIMHGSSKVFETMPSFTTAVAGMGFPMPEVFAWAAALSEFGGGILLVLGLGTRVAAVFGSITMIVAAFLSNPAAPFAKRELALVYLVLLVVFFMIGGGRYSLDAYLMRRRTP